MAGERYMNATTRYMKGNGVEGSVNKRSPSPSQDAKREKSISQPRPNTSRPKVEEKAEPKVQPKAEEKARPKPQVARQPVSPPKQETQAVVSSRPGSQPRQNNLIN